MLRVSCVKRGWTTAPPVPATQVNSNSQSLFSNLSIKLHSSAQMWSAPVLGKDTSAVPALMDSWETDRSVLHQGYTI